jgi:hypothetical protein
MKKLLTAASIAALSLGVANAIDVEAGVGNSAGNAVSAIGPNAYPLSTRLAGGTYEDVDVAFDVTFTNIPSGSGVVTITLTNATFAAAPTTSDNDPISTGGTVGSNTVSFLVNSLTNFDSGTVSTVLDLVEGENPSVEVSVINAASFPIENSVDVPAADTFIVFGEPYTAEIAADTTTTRAALSSGATAPFLSFETTNADDVIGTFAVDVNQVVVGSTSPAPPAVPAPIELDVNKDLAGNPVVASDIGDIDVSIVGNFDAFINEDETDGVVITGGASTVRLSEDEVDDSTAEGSVNEPATAPFALTFALDPDGETAIEASDYALTAVLDLTYTSSPFSSDLTVAGNLQSVARAGTSVVFPWTASATQSAASGSTNIFRLGNVGGTDTGAVFATVRSTNVESFTGVGEAEQVAASIGANGELVVTSQALEDALGDWGRGDIEMTVEAQPSNITARRFIVRDSGIQSLDNGTVAQNN